MSGLSYFGAPAHLRQERCDRVVENYRSEQSVADVPARPALRRDPANDAPRKSIRRDPPPAIPTLVPTDNALLVRVSEELDYARRMLDSMGDALTSDPGLIARHDTSLQSIDIIGQMLGHLAAVVRSADPSQAVERIGMAELKARLIRKSVL